MGFTTLIDVIGSMIIGGIVMMLLFRLNDAGTENVYNNTGELIAQENIATLVSILEYDFRKIGYSDSLGQMAKKTKLSDIIPIADSTHIQFLADVDPQLPGWEKVDYYTGPTSELLSTPNPRDRYLYRVIGDETPVPVNLGLTYFRIRYYDGLGNELTNYPVEGAQRMMIDVAVENVYAYDPSHYDSTRSQVFWRQIRLSVNNLKR